MTISRLSKLLKNRKEGNFKLRGWIGDKRVLKDIAFLDFFDGMDCIQAVGSLKKLGKEKFEKFCSIPRESAIIIEGNFTENKKTREFEIKVESFSVLKKAQISLFPSPRSKSFDPFEQSNINQINKHPAFYLRNPKLAAVFKFKTLFIHNLASYLWDNGFVAFESPTITLQTLYDDSGAFWINLGKQKATLSRCATFHLESALMAYTKVFTIANSFSKEKSRSDRHLVEFTHLKVEIAWACLEDLIKIAGKIYYEVAKKTYERCKKEISVLGIEDIETWIEKINPKNHIIVNYEEALEILRKKGFNKSFGRSISVFEESVLTSHFNDRFIWIKYLPCSVEGFPFKRKKDDPRLSMAADLIAPKGFGEILGTAEKITEYEEITERMIEKGKKSPNQFKRYKDYLDLRKYGLPEHGGIGMGIDRSVRFILQLPHVRFTRPFPVIHGTKIHH